MKPKQLFLHIVLPLMLLTLLFAASAPPSLAARNYIDLLGTAAPSSAATRIIVIYPSTRYVNVEGGQIVRFLAGDKTFTWHFNVARTVGSFDLNQVFPAGILDHVVRAYITPDPSYFGP
jgi:hypothetical protein